MDNTMLHALKSLMEQIKAAPTTGQEIAHDNADRVRIADVRSAAEDAKDNLRHSFGR